MERLGRYANDGKGEAIEEDGLADDDGVRREFGCPELMAQHNDRITAPHFVLVSTEATPQLRMHAQHVEEIPAHQRTESHPGQLRLVRREAKLEILGGG